jgi:LEA14-like dessication related protein
MKLTAIKISMGLFIGGLIAYTSNFIYRQISLLKESNFEFAGTKITKLSLRKITIRLDWRIINKSDIGAVVSNQEYQVFLNNTFIRKIGYTEPLKIPNNSETTVPTYISIEPEDLKKIGLNNLSKFLTSEGRETLRLKVVGSFDVKVEFINIKKFPIEFEDTIENIYNY